MVTTISKTGKLAHKSLPNENVRDVFLLLANIKLCLRQNVEYLKMLGGLHFRRKYLQY